jgi:hypothetical protein
VAWVDYVLAGGIGALVGASELIARYRDNPQRALATLPAFIYIALNASASLAALGITRVFGWSFGFNGTAEGLRWIQVFATGFGAMALFRTSLFQVRVGNQDIGIGPISLLQVALSAADRAVDRTRASSRSDAAVKIMKGISFEKAKSILPSYCIALLQGASAEDQNALGDNVRKLGASSDDDSTNALILGLLLMNLAGEKVLESSVKALRQQLTQPPGAPRGAASVPPAPAPPAPARPPPLREPASAAAPGAPESPEGHGAATGVKPNGEAAAKLDDPGGKNID